MVEQAIALEAQRILRYVDSDPICKGDRACFLNRLKQESLDRIAQEDFRMRSIEKAYQLQ